MNRTEDRAALVLAEAIGSVHLRLRVQVDRAMASTGLSLARYRLLRYIEDNEPTRASDIRRFFGYSPRSVTEAVDALERAGLIRRTRTEADQRVIAITIEPDGRQAIAAAGKPLIDVTGRAFAPLSGEQREQLLDLLEMVGQSL